MGRTRPQARVALLSAAAALAVVAVAPSTATAAKLKVGVARADITPPTGYFSMGYVRGDGLIEGAYGRLWAKAIVLEQGNRKLALLTADLGGIPGGALEAAVERVADRGFDLENVIATASHTHGGPAGMFPFGTYNTVFMTVNSPTDFDIGGSFDPQLYGFMIRRFATALRRADRALGPGRAGWGSARLTDVTVNRSIEAHLRNHGIERARGEGSADQDPQGVTHTIDPRVDVLRVDRRARSGRWLPVGIWTTFGNHGTVVKYQFRYYNGDHHIGAVDYTERQMRRRGRVPFGRRIVTAYGNGAEGDMTAGIHNDGPAAAERVGRREGRAMMEAWERAGRRMRRTIELETRWTRMCFCGQMTSEGPIDDEGDFGVAQLTGSEENRGPLFDLTRVVQEGIAGPEMGPQGTKVVADLPLSVPEAVPVTVARVGDRVIGTVPGEATKQFGSRIRGALMGAAAGTGVERAVVAGVSNEFTSYFTTPEEYSVQHYEGASTLYGTNASVAVLDVLAELGERLASGRPAPAPFEYDAANGRAPDHTPFPRGAESAEPIEQPALRVERLGDQRFRWSGGERGFDRPLDRAFIRVQHKMRHGKREWKTIAKDLHLTVLWFVDADGKYTLRWEPRRGAPLGTYRFLIQGRRYRLASDSFRLRASRALSVAQVPAPAGRVAVELRYPDPVAREEIDDPPPDADATLGHRPARAGSGRVTFLVDGESVPARAVEGRFEVEVPAGAAVRIAAGGARDRAGNRNGEALDLAN